MSLSALIRRMADAGAPPEAIALAVEAIEAEQAKDAARRAKRAAAKAAERDKARLSRDIAATSCDVNATPPALKDVEPKLLTVQVNQNPPPYSPPAPKNSRGSRLSADAAMSERNRADASRIGVPADRVEPLWQRYRDYWTAKPGRDAVKLDWDATWRNWCSSECERKGWAPSSPSQSGSDPPRGVKISPVTDPDAWEAWRAERGGKSLPTDNTGFWIVPSRLPNTKEGVAA